MVRPLDAGDFGEAVPRRSSRRARTRSHDRSALDLPRAARCYVTAACDAAAHLHAHAGSTASQPRPLMSTGHPVSVDLGVARAGRRGPVRGSPRTCARAVRGCGDAGNGRLRVGAWWGSPLLRCSPRARVAHTAPHRGRATALPYPAPTRSAVGAGEGSCAAPRGLRLARPARSLKRLSAVWSGRLRRSALHVAPPAASAGRACGRARPSRPRAPRRDAAADRTGCARRARRG